MHAAARACRQLGWVPSAPGLRAEDKANAPAGKPPSAGTAAGHPPAASHAGSASLTAAASANGAAASTAGGAPSTAGTALTQQGAKGGLGIKPSSAGVEAALQAVLNKPEQGIRGLSVAPDESLTKDKASGTHPGGGEGRARSWCLCDAAWTAGSARAVCAGWAPTCSLSLQVNKDVLEKMRQTFARADADGTGELSPEEFCASFKGQSAKGQVGPGACGPARARAAQSAGGVRRRRACAYGAMRVRVCLCAGILHTEDGSDEGSLKKLFMRIDANSDGSVNWDEFIGFLLLESQGAANLRDLENSISFDPPGAP